MECENRSVRFINSYELSELCLQCDDHYSQKLVHFDPETYTYVHQICIRCLENIAKTQPDRFHCPVCDIKITSINGLSPSAFFEKWGSQEGTDETNKKREAILSAVRLNSDYFVQHPQYYGDAEIVLEQVVQHGGAYFQYAEGHLKSDLSIISDAMARIIDHGVHRQKNGVPEAIAFAIDECITLVSYSAFQNDPEIQSTLDQYHLLIS